MNANFYWQKEYGKPFPRLLHKLIRAMKPHPTYIRLSNEVSNFYADYPDGDEAPPLAKWAQRIRELEAQVEAASRKSA